MGKLFKVRNLRHNMISSTRVQFVTGLESREWTPPSLSVYATTNQFTKTFFFSFNFLHLDALEFDRLFKQPIDHLQPYSSGRSLIISCLESIFS